MAKNEDFFPRDVCARLIGISTSHFDKRFSGKIPDTARIKTGKRVLLHAPTIIRLWHEEELESVAGADPDMAGPSSPALAKAKRAERDLAVLEHELMPWAECKAGMLAGMGIIRRASERIQRKDPECHRMLAEAIPDAIAACLAAWPEPETKTTTD